MSFYVNVDTLNRGINVSAMPVVYKVTLVIYKGTGKGNVKL